MYSLGNTRIENKYGIIIMTWGGKITVISEKLKRNNDMARKVNIDMVGKEK